MNRSKIFIAALLVILILLGASSWPMFVSTVNFTYANADKYTSGSTEITDVIKSLDVEWIAGSVKTKFYSGSSISVSETSPQDLREEDLLRWWVDGTTLRIRYAKPGLRMSKNPEKTLTILLPVLDLESAEFRTTSADLEINHLIADEMLLKTTSGDISAATVTKKLTAASTSGNMEISQEKEMDSASLSSTSGNITFLHYNNAKTVSVRTTSGDIRMNLGHAETIQVESTSGTINMDGAGDYTRIHSVSGNITHYASEEGTAEISSNSGRVDVDSPNFKNMKISTTSGDVFAMLRSEPHGFDCTVSTTSGSVFTEDAAKKEGNTYYWNASPWQSHAYVSTTSGDIRISQSSSGTT